MSIRRSTVLLTVVLWLAFAGCSGSDSDSSGTAQDATACELAGQEVVERFDLFLEPFADMTPDEFLDDPDLDGLESFQNDVAEIIVNVATNPNDDCTERDLEQQVDQALASYAGEGLLQQYLVGTIRQGLQVERRDIIVSPADDLTALLPLLGPGSSITFSKGTFELDSTILVQSDLTMVGAGREATLLESSADTAAFAVLGQGSLTMNDLSVRHVGEAPASVLLAIDASISLVGVGIHGGVTDAEGAGGTGLLLDDTDGDGTVAVTVSDSVLSENASAGIAVTGEVAPTVIDSMITSNGQCGVCFFDSSGGQVQSTTFEGNGVGLQSSANSAPEIANNSFVDNIVAGVLIEDMSALTLVGNTFTGDDIVGVDVQGDAAPVIQRNTFGSHAVAISLRGGSSASASENMVTGGAVGFLIGGSATPAVFDNQVADTTVTAFLHTESSQGEFVANVVAITEGAGTVVEGSAAPELLDGTYTGGVAGIVYRQEASGRVARSTLTGQQVGLEVGDNARPLIDGNVFAESIEAGVILGSRQPVELRDNMIDEPQQIGIQTDGDGAPLVDSNTVRGGDTAVLVTGASQAMILNNTLVDQNFGIGVSGTATPTITDNEIRNAAAGAMSFEGDTGGEVSSNTVIDAGVVGFRIAGTASPTIEANTLFALVQSGGEQATADGDAAVSGAGLLYADSATGIAELNQVFGFVIGIQVSDMATPELVANRVDGAGVGGVGILYGIEAGGRAEGNLSINQQLGFQLSGTAGPELIDNTVEAATAAAFLLQGSTTAQLRGNSCPGSTAGIVVLEQAVPVLDDNDCALAQ